MLARDVNSSVLIASVVAQPTVLRTSSVKVAVYMVFGVGVGVKLLLFWVTATTPRSHGH